jgi:hypothetical protein
MQLRNNTRFEHPELRDVRQVLSSVRAQVRASREDVATRKAASPMARIKASPLPIVAVIGESGTGKSHIITSYFEEVVNKENYHAEGLRRVVDFELSADANKRQLQVDLLIAYEDPDPEKGTDAVLRRRVAKLAKAKETEIALIDEVQHFIESDTEKRKKSVADAFKKIVNADVFGLALFGTEKAEGIFNASDELAQRVITVIKLKGVDVEHSPTERMTYREYLQCFRHTMEVRSLISDASTLEDPITVGCLALAARAQFGTTYRILEAAFRNALESGADTFRREHFSLAIQRGGMHFGCKDNPFADA